MRWTIAILTVPQRAKQFNTLLADLECQIAQLGVEDIEVLVAGGTDRSISAKRQWCLDNARGEYFNFIDDDDEIADDYVESIHPLLDGVDYIGFQLQFYWNGRPWAPTYHSLRYDRWFSDAEGYYRNISHLNPIRTEIGRQGAFDGGYGEDRRWSEQVHPQTEHYIDKVLYHYLFSPEGSLSTRA